MKADITQVEKPEKTLKEALEIIRSIHEKPTNDQALGH
jgi:hypothetical protein